MRAAVGMHFCCCCSGGKTKEVARDILGRLGFLGLLLVVGRCMMLYLMSVHSLNIYNISVLCCTPPRFRVR